MKVTLLLLALAVACALAQVNPLDTYDSKTFALKSWSGTTEMSPLWYAPSTTVSPCAVVTSPSNYAVMNYTFATNGTRIVGVVAERGFQPFVDVLLFKGSFTPSTTAGSSGSCTGFQRQMANKNAGGDLGLMIINDPTYFEAGTPYFFVVYGTATGKAGRFSLSVFASTAAGTTVGGPLWTPPVTNYTGCYNATASPQNVGSFTFQATSTDFFDVLVYFATETATSDPSHNQVYMALTTGQFTTAQVATNSCSTTQSIISSYNGDQITPLYRYSLTKDQFYTISVSNGAQAGYWGVSVMQSRANSAKPTTFPQPQRTLPCAANTTAAAAGYVLYTFTATGKQAFIDTFAYPSWFTTILSFDAYAFIYSGANVGPVSCPSSAPLINVNKTDTTTGSIVFSTNIGQEYDIIFSTSSGTILANGAGLQIFFFTGEYVGNPAAYIPDGGATSTATSGATSTGSGTTSTNSTSSTTGAATSGTTQTSTGGAGSGTTHASSTTETSSASAVAVSAMVLVALAALL